MRDFTPTPCFYWGCRLRLIPLRARWRHHHVCAYVQHKFKVQMDLLRASLTHADIKCSSVTPSCDFSSANALHYSSQLKCKEPLLANIWWKVFNVFTLQSSFKQPNVSLFCSLLSCPLPKTHPGLTSLCFNTTFPFNLIPSNSCSIRRQLLCPQVQLWDRAGWDARRQLCDRQGCYSKIGLESEVLSVSVKRAAAKWLQPSISAPSESSELLLHDS